MSDTCRDHGRMCERIDNLVEKLDEYIKLQKETNTMNEQQQRDEIERIHARIKEKDVERQDSEERLEGKVDDVNKKIDDLKEYVHSTIQRTLVWLVIFVGGGVVTWMATQVVRLVAESGGTP